MAHHTEKAAVRGEATKEDATEPALAVLDVCRPLAGKPDYLLTNASTGVMPRIEMDTVEAKAWLLLAKVNLESGPGHAACRQKLQEHALRLFASVEAALPPDGEMVGEYADYVADQCANSYELLVRACMMGGDWASAVATGGEILELVRRFQHRCSPSPRAHLCMVLMSVAECIAHGRKAYGFCHMHSDHAFRHRSGQREGRFGGPGGRVADAADGHAVRHRPPRRRLGRAV